MDVNIEPLFGLRLWTARLELRLPTEAELAELARVAEQGVHPADQMPFLYPWTDTAGSPTFLSDFLAFHRSLRDTWRPDKWTLECGVWADGELMGVQGVNAANFHQQRVVATGSWLGQRFQGRGYGMEMRVAVLHLAFSGLGATAADTGVLEGNIASERVSAKLGYVRSGERTVAPRGKPVREQYFRLESTRWTQVERPPVEIVGLDECLPLFGVTT